MDTGHRGSTRRPSGRRRLLVITTCGVAGFAIAYGLVYWSNLSVEWEREEALRATLSAFEENAAKSTNQQKIEAAVHQIAEIEPLRVTPPAASSTPQAADASAPSEWLELPRTKFRLAATLEKRQDLVGRRLFRNETLNPTDEPIPLADRQAFDVWLLQAATALGDLREAIDQVANQELNFMINKGLARTASYSEYVSTLDGDALADIRSYQEHMRKALEDAGATEAEIEATIRDHKSFNPGKVCQGSFCHATRANDDFIYMGDLERMPQTLNAAESYRASCLITYGQILGFFQSHCALSDAAISKALEEVEEALARYQP